MTDVRTYKFYAGGTWRDAEGSQVLDDFEPYSGRLFVRVPAGGHKEARIAIDQFLDDVFNRIKRSKAALGDDAMGRTIGFLELPIGLRVPCYLFPQRGNSLAGDAAEPKKWPER
jgi:hypothetical protein